MPLTIFCNHRFLDDTANALLADEVRRLGHRLVYSASITTSNLSSSAADPAINEADVAFGQPNPASIIAAPRLKFVQLTTAGYERYDRADLREAMAARGAALCTSSSVYAEPVAQHTLAMMMSMSRVLPWSHDEQRTTRAWSAAAMREKCRLLTGQTVVILSYGTIAKRLVELLAPLKVNVIAVRRKPSGNESVRTVAESDVDSVLPLADHLVNILPGGPATRGFMSAKRFGLMKAGSYFYNVGRGPTVDQDGLLGALKSGHLAGAYLDVTDPEPLPKDHPLWSAANCIITPHTAGGHHDEFHRIVGHFIENLSAFEAGRAVRDRVI